MGKRIKNEPAVLGDVLGLTDDRTGIKLPHPPSDGSTPAGIDVRPESPRHWGTEDLEGSKGAVGIDMGSGGEGTDVAPEHPRPRSADEV